MIDVTEIRCLDSVDVDVTKLAWRFDETGAGLDSTAWRLDSNVTEIRSLDSVNQRAIMKSVEFGRNHLSKSTRIGNSATGPVADQKHL